MDSLVSLIRELRGLAAEVAIVFLVYNVTRKKR
jgi:hypothetical protein